MKATATAQNLTPGLETGRLWLAVFADLVKARLTLLVLLTTLAGFYVGGRGRLEVALMLHTLAGTALLAAGAAALNQWSERREDALMRRTQNRPLPAGRLRPETVLSFGAACSIAGLLRLAVAVNGLTALLGAITLGSYLFVYTPLKRVTWLNTLVGAVPGALPPVLGWTAARGELSAGGWALFAILALWQVPHFLAIAWICREEYARAGFRMLPAVDPTGRRTAWQAVGFTAALLLAGGGPFALGLAGPLHATGALLLGGAYLGCALRFARQRTGVRARQLFLASVLYLPLLLAVLALDNVK